MFDSGILAKKLIEDIKNEVDVALPIPNSSYVTWLNSLQYMLYSSIIREQHKISTNLADDNIVVLDTLPVADNESAIRFEDIYTVFAGNVQLIKANITNEDVFSDCFYKSNNNMAVRLNNHVPKLDIVYHIKPAMVMVDDKDEIQCGNIMLPIEFIEIVKSKLRAEAYMIENEYIPATNWISNYNVLVENFKHWLDNNAAQFGM